MHQIGSQFQPTVAQSAIMGQSYSISIERLNHVMPNQAIVLLGWVIKCLNQANEAP